MTICCSLLHDSLYNIGVQKELTQDISFWHADHFELKTIKVQKIREEPLTSSLNVKRVWMEAQLQEGKYHHKLLQYNMN